MTKEELKEKQMRLATVKKELHKEIMSLVKTASKLIKQYNEIDSALKGRVQEKDCEDVENVVAT